MMNLRSRGEVVDNAQLASKLCADSVELGAAHARHMATHGNFIPHAFMADVLARAGVCVVAEGENSDYRRVELASILTTLEGALAGGHRETCSVICISFVWDGESEPFFQALKPLLGPRLGAFARR